MKKILSKIQLLALDTNIVAYYLNRLSSFYPLSVKLFEYIIKKDISMVTSILTLTELLSLKAPEPMMKVLENEFFSISKLEVQEVDRMIAVKAAKIRRKYGFKLPDAIQLATALSAKARVFITNDQHMKNFKELKIVPLASFSKLSTKAS
ncbi:MAG: PIN domain-containing protein [bacterium]|nr:PIN domain-containing protein [bacterium]